jgi:alpha-beta hydrolase superfamily lysophospholipase
MKFYSGFALRGEEELFREYLTGSEFEVAGFSYGAIKALERVLESESRVDRLTLLSPAFFQREDEKFKRVQLINFKRDKDAYIENFLKNVSYPSMLDLSRYLAKATYEELEELLSYEYKRDDLQRLVQKGVKIDIYIGGEDRITDVAGIEEFFREFATINLIKKGGHILRWRD